MSGRVIIPPVRTFASIAADKAQALKVLEEAAEVFGAWQKFDLAETPGERAAAMREVLDETADVVQACCNLAWAFGMHDLHAEMAACEARNEKRGRY